MNYLLNSRIEAISDIVISIADIFLSDKKYDPTMLILAFIYFFDVIYFLFLSFILYKGMLSIGQEEIGVDFSEIWQGA